MSAVWSQVRCREDAAKRRKALLQGCDQHRLSRLQRAQKLDANARTKIAYLTSPRRAHLDSDEALRKRRALVLASGRRGPGCSGPVRTARSCTGGHDTSRGRCDHGWWRRCEQIAKGGARRRSRVRGRWREGKTCDGSKLIQIVRVADIHGAPLSLQTVRSSRGESWHLGQSGDRDAGVRGCKKDTWHAIGTRKAFGRPCSRNTTQQAALGD